MDALTLPSGIQALDEVLQGIRLGDNVVWQVDRLEALGVAIPQMAHLATELNRQLGTNFDFLTVDEAQEALAVHIA